jgi:hypothetical protein
MGQLTHEQYNALERAIVEQRRISAFRRGSEYILVPLRLATRAGRELIEAQNPTTGDHMALYLDELDHFEIV